MQQAFAKIRTQDFAGADSELAEVIDSTAFSLLEPQEQNSVLYTAGMLAIEFKDPKRAHALLVRSSTMAVANAEDWHARLRAALELNDIPDAVLSLTTIAQRWPDTLPDVRDHAVLRLASEARKLPRPDTTWLPLAQALYRAHWKLGDQREPSGLWRDLTQYYVDRKMWDQATDVAAHITSPYVLIELRADRRFDRVMTTNPLISNIDRAAALEIEQLQAAVVQAPRSLEARNQLAYSLLKLNRYDEALKVSEDTLARVKAADPKSPPFDDADDQFNWVVDNHARALYTLGRWDEAVAEWVRASQLHEHGSDNVSQAINLGNFFCELDRPRDALVAVAVVLEVSPYGRMQLESVRHAAAVELNAKDEAARALTYLREHQADDPGTYQWALIRAKDENEGARFLIARLADPNLRGDALSDVQNFTEPLVPPRAMEWRTRWTALVARPDVQAAIAKVGRVEHYALASRDF
jgi:tetratricopeptide (TPR) repeat protein